MNITKEQIKEWLSNNFLERRFGCITDNDIANAFDKCFNDLSPKWVSVDDELPSQGGYCHFHIPLRGYPLNVITGYILESGIILSIDGEDHGYDIEQVEKWMTVIDPQK